ncbi:MAG: YbhN family protein [Gemmataceae bacterium]
MSHRFFWTLLKYAIGLAILGAVIWSNWAPEGRPGLSDIDFRSIAPRFIALAWSCVFLAVSCTVFRWYILIRAQGLPVTLQEVIRLGLLGHALSTLLPGVVGGDIVKAATLARGQSRRTVAIATIVFDRVVGMAGLFWLVAILGSLLQAAGGVQSATLQYVVLGACTIAGFTFLLWVGVNLIPRSWIKPVAKRLTDVPKVGHALSELWRTLDMYRMRGKNVLAALLLSMLGHALTIFAFYYSSRSLFPDVRPPAIPPLKDHLLMVPVGMTIQAGFPTPGGVGGGEFAFGKLYEQLGGDGAKGVSMAFLHRIVVYSVSLVGYLIFLQMRPSSPLLTVTESQGDQDSNIEETITPSYDEHGTPPRMR